MDQIEIFALNYFGRLKIEDIQVLKDKSIKELLDSSFMETDERLKARYDEKFVAEQRERVRKLGVRVIDYWSEDYPPLLRESLSPPVVLFCLGDIRLLRDRCVSVVGTRKATSYGKAVVKKLTSQLVEAGFVIVSGLAFGIDALAHEVALKMGGKTVAILGTGVDVCYPSSNRRIYDQILQKGCVVSEFPMGTKPAKHQFPMRNRIIAGLSRATIVIEAPMGSGALITAQQAAEIGREVFAVPGDIDRKTSEGCNWLIKMGATPLLDCEQVLELYGLSKQTVKEEDDFLKIFDEGPLQVEELSLKTGLSLPEVLAKLTEYELAGKIVKMSDGSYHKT